MRLLITALPLLAIGLAGLGCGPEFGSSGEDDLFTAVTGLAETGESDPAVPTGRMLDGATVVAGSLAGDDDYQLIELGPAQAGQRWMVTDASGLLTNNPFLVVLLDSKYDLLYRQIVSSRWPLEHVLRADTSTLYLGVMPSYATADGGFRFSVSRESGVTVPAPRGQLVWLNFGGGQEVRVQGRRGISFPAFDSGRLGPAYAGATETVKAAIVSAMREDYAAYNVVILTSDEGPAPDQPHATLHFGGVDNLLLGLADNVDQYNADPWQTAIIYVDGFADFSVMNLTAEEMGQMIGNVASHELGHLLGLFHTRVPADLMDTTGTAWDLAGDQSFTRAELEQSVFAVGFENCPVKLAQTVGRMPQAKGEHLARAMGAAKMEQKAKLRALVEQELQTRCGTCLELDR